MSSDLKEILMRIEDLRYRLHELYELKGLEDQEVLVASQILDATLNEYYLIFKDKLQTEEKLERFLISKS
ncbi:MAG: aspartyl-phosphate phosphatase Spo0E family protein [Bacillota bacterium]